MSNNPLEHYIRLPLRDVVDMKSRGCRKLKSGKDIIIVRRSVLYDDIMSFDDAWLFKTDVKMW